ncbi:MAG: hypothetical protein ABMA13_22240 [Chthoniobacteraceae bacterium]
MACRLAPAEAPPPGTSGRSSRSATRTTTAPSPSAARGASARTSFVAVADDDRPDFFRTRATAALDIYRTSVTVFGTPNVFPDDVFFDIPVLPPPTTLVGLLGEIALRQILASLRLHPRIGLQQLLPPYKLGVGPAAVNLSGKPEFRLAWLWLVRAPGAHPRFDRVFVQQTCFWNLAAWTALEDQGVLQIVPLLQAGGDIGNLAGLTLFELLAGAQKTRWWSV